MAFKANNTRNIGPGGAHAHCAVQGCYVLNIQLGLPEFGESKD